MKRITDNSAALIAAGAFCLCRGISYVPALQNRDPLPQGIAMASSFFGLGFWITVWLAVGAFSLASVRGKPECRNRAWAAIVGIHLAWAAAYAWGYIGAAFTTELLIRDVMRSLEYLTYGITAGFLSRTFLKDGGEGK